MESPVRDDKQFRLESVLLQALKTALAEPTEQRLYRAGKLEGLFPSKIGLSLEAAQYAVRHELLELTRTEAKGPVSIEWVKIAPRGVEYVYSHDSPRAVLSEMRQVLSSGKAAVPGLIAGMQGELAGLAKRFADEIESYRKRLDMLTHRVEEALRRMDAAGPTLADPLQTLIPWAYDALRYLDGRKETRRADPCTLAELFTAVQSTHPHLTIPAFQDGLRRLVDNRAIVLQPVPLESIDRPEFALASTQGMLYHIAR
jgi:hypothetical protein